MAYPPPQHAWPQPPPAPVRRRRNWPLRLLVVLVVLVGLAVAADRIAVAVAERIAGESIQSSQNLPTRPDVDIHGFPFLTQLASASYDDVDITAHDVPVGTDERQIDIDTIAVHLSGVTTARDFDSVRADSATADARITFDDLARTLGVRALEYGGPGRVQSALSVSIAGRTVQAGVSAAVTASGGDSIEFSNVRVSGGATGVPGASAALGQAFTVPIPLDGLPFQIRVTGVDVDASGVVIHLSGRNLSYESS